MMEQRHLKLSGGAECSYEALTDDRFLVAPEWPSRETSADAISGRARGRRMSPEEIDRPTSQHPPARRA